MTVEQGLHKKDLIVDSLGGHLLQDRTARTRRGLGTPGLYSSETAKPPAPPSMPKPPQMPKLPETVAPKTTDGTGEGQQQRRALGLGDDGGPGVIKPSAPSPRSAPGPSAPKPSAPGLPNTAPAPASVGGSSRISDFDYLNSTRGEQHRVSDNGAMPQGPALGRPAPPPRPQGNPITGDMEPNWGQGDGQSHFSDEPDSWGGHPQLDDPEWTARRKSGMFWRLSLRR